MLLLISYDIVETKKRNKIVKILEKYGTRVQFSVFECDLVERQKLDLQSKLIKIMKEFENNEDSIRFYKICEKCPHSNENSWKSKNRYSGGVCYFLTQNSRTFCELFFFFFKKVFVFIMFCFFLFLAKSLRFFYRSAIVCAG